MRSDREEATDARCRDGGGRPVLGPAPEEAAKDAAAVEGKRRDEIEHEQEHVHDRQPLGDDDHEGRCADLQKQPGRADEDGGQCCRHGRSDRSDEHLRPAVCQSPLIWATPPNSQSLMPCDLHAAPAGKERVSKFMSGQRGDQEHRSNHPDDPREPARRSGDGVRDSTFGNAVGEQGADDEHAPVRRDLDPGDTSDGDAASVHRAISHGERRCFHLHERTHSEAELARVAHRCRDRASNARAGGELRTRGAHDEDTPGRRHQQQHPRSGPAGKADGVLRQVAEARKRQQRPDGRRRRRSPARATGAHLVGRPARRALRRALGRAASGHVRADGVTRRAKASLPRRASARRARDAGGRPSPAIRPRLLPRSRPRPPAGTRPGACPRSEPKRPLVPCICAVGELLGIAIAVRNEPSDLGPAPISPIARLAAAPRIAPRRARQSRLPIMYAAIPITSWGLAMAAVNPSANPAAPGLIAPPEARRRSASPSTETPSH